MRPCKARAIGRKLDGLQSKYQRELLSPDSATRLTAAAMLLRLGDRSVVPAIARDLPALLSWLGPEAPNRLQAAILVNQEAGLDGANLLAVIYCRCCLPRLPQVT